MPVKTGRPDGIQIRHVTARSQLCLVELYDRPFYLSYGAAGVCDGKNGRPFIPAPILDCSCGVPHQYKTVHVNVDDTGAALVSQGVLDLIRSAGETGFSVVGHTPNPPTIRLGIERIALDFANRTIAPLTPPKVNTNHG